jgi:poly(A) polymerase
MKTYSVDWYHHLPEHAKGILETLQNAGFEAYAVGGCVRDLWLGLQPKDFDIVSSATPEEVEKLFPRTEGVGRQFGIMVVVTDSGPVEVARFRADAEYKDGRHPESVVFSSPEEDAKRRDFTINALFYDPRKGLVIDYVDGVADLKGRLLRCVGDPSARFQEDALRMLRAARFHAQLGERGFSLDAEIIPAIRAQAERLRLVSRERITQEICRMFLSPKPALGLRDLIDMKLWQIIFACPEINNHTLLRFDSLKDAAREATGQSLTLAVAVGAAARWLPDWEWESGFVLNRESKAAARHIPALALTLEIFSNLDLAGQKGLLADPLFPEAWAVLKAEKNLLGTEALNEIKRKKTTWEQAGTLNPPALLKGADLIAAGFQAGPTIKTILEKVRRAQLNEQIHSTEEALSLARKV